MLIHRRTALAAASAAMLPAADRVRGAIIGAGGRGRYLTGEFKEIGVEMGWLEPEFLIGRADRLGKNEYANYLRRRAVELAQ